VASRPICILLMHLIHEDIKKRTTTSEILRLTPLAAKYIDHYLDLHRSKMVPGGESTTYHG